MLWTLLLAFALGGFQCSEPLLLNLRGNEVRSILALVVGFVIWGVATLAAIFTIVPQFNLSARIPSFIAFYLVTALALIIASIAHQRLFKDIPVSKHMVRLIMVVSVWIAIGLLYQQDTQPHEMFGHAGTFAALLTVFIQNRRKKLAN